MVDTGLYKKSSAQFLLKFLRGHRRDKINMDEIYTEPIRVNSRALSLRVTGVWNKREIHEDQHNKRKLYGGSSV